MPLYRFRLDVSLPPEAVAERLRAVVRKRRGIRECIQELWKPRDVALTQFVGSVHDGSFSLHRAIHGRSSFLPVIRGRIRATATGTRMTATMFLHPAVIIFLIWLGAFGTGFVTNPRTVRIDMWVVLLLLFVVFGVTDFFLEARKAKDLLNAAVLGRLKPE